GFAIRLQNANQASRSAVPSTVARRLAADDETVPAPAATNGGLVMTRSNAPGTSSIGGLVTSAATNRTLSAMPFAAALKFASSTVAGSESIPTTRTPPTRAARHKAAAPTPQPTSNTVWPGTAGTAAASS